MMEMRFSDSKGFNYLLFLEELLPYEKLENKYKTRASQLLAKRERVGMCITIVLACMIITGFLYMYMCNALYMSAVLIT